MVKNGNYEMITNSNLFKNFKKIVILERIIIKKYSKFSLVCRDEFLDTYWKTHFDLDYSTKNLYNDLKKLPSNINETLDGFREKNADKIYVGSHNVRVITQMTYCDFFVLRCDLNKFLNEMNYSRSYNYLKEITGKLISLASKEEIDRIEKSNLFFLNINDNMNELMDYIDDFMSHKRKPNYSNHEKICRRSFLEKLYLVDFVLKKCIKALKSDDKESLFLYLYMLASCMRFFEKYYKKIYRRFYRFSHSYYWYLGKEHGDALFYKYLSHSLIGPLPSTL